MSNAGPLAVSQQSERTRADDEPNEVARYRLFSRMARHWPGFLIFSGFACFAVACIGSDRLPTEALFVGPLMMTAGAVLKERNRREPPADSPKR